MTMALLIKMNQSILANLLAHLPLGDIRYFDSIGSTNDEALAWANKGVPDLSIIVADEQTRGRGRMDRPWFTRPGTALAFSLILRPTSQEKRYLSRLVGLAGLAITEAIQKLWPEPKIKGANGVRVEADRKSTR